MCRGWLPWFLRNGNFPAGSRIVISEVPCLTEVVLMRVLTGTVVLAVASAVGLVQPASARGAADPAPTNVRIAWADPSTSTVRVSWDEVGSQPNQLQLLTADGVQTSSGYASTTADQPNQVDVVLASVGGGAVRMAVYIGTSIDELTSPPGLSVPFDQLPTPDPVLQPLSLGPDGAVTLRWQAGAVQTDPAPDDPLDLPAPPARHQVDVIRPGYESYQPFGEPLTATQLTLPRWDPPFTFRIGSLPNEWGGGSTGGSVLGERFTRLSIPSSVTYGLSTVIAGSVQRLWLVSMPGPFSIYPYEDVGRLVVLQARTNASTPWYVVGTTRSTSVGAPYDSAFRFAPVALGTRQYRVVVPNVFWSNVLSMGVTSGVVTTLTRARVLSAGFTDSTATVGQRVTARVRISPAANVRTTLQRWDGVAWRDLKWVYLVSGAGSYTFTAAQRGRFAYRFLIPNFTYAGRPVSWQVSPNFVLTTR